MHEHEVTKRQAALAARVSTDALLASFADFLRLDVAQGDASPHTLRSYHTQARQFLAWCQREGIHPATASEGDILAYRRYLVDAGYTRATVGLKLAVVRRLYEAARWRGLRLDNPAAGVKPPREHTAREERVKYLPLDGLRRLLAAPLGDSAQAQRDRAILALMGVHGLRVGEVAGLLVTDVDLEQGQATVKGKGQKVRTVYLTEATAGVLADWLAVRDAIASAGVDTLFVGTGHHGAGAALSTRGLRFLVDGYLERLGLKAQGMSCHSLRHSAATWARAGGAKLDAIGAMLGHASIQTTTVYAKIVDRMAENPARYLEGLLGES